MKWLKRVLLSLAVLLPLGFFGVPLLLGTSWAREKVRGALARGTGREVSIGDISFSWFRGLRLRDVVVRQRAGDYAGEGPLFSLGDLDLKVGLGDVLRRRINVERFSVREPVIVIVRDRAGRFNFDDLLEKPAAKAGGGAPGGGGGEGPHGEGEGEPGGGGGTPIRVNFSLTGGRIVYLDRKLGTRVEARGIDARASFADGRLRLELDCALNGGNVRLDLETRLAEKPASFTVRELRIEGAEFTSDLAPLGLFLPLLGEKPQKVSGKLAFVLRDVKGLGFEPDLLKRTISGRGHRSLEGGGIASGPVSQLFSAFRAIGAADLEPLRGAGGGEELSVKLVEGDFEIRDGKIRTDDLSVKGSGLDLSLSGWTRLDGKLRYEMIAGNLEELLRRNRTLGKYLGESGGLPLKLRGTLDDPEIRVDVEGALKGAAEGAIREGLGGLLPGGKDEGREKKEKKEKKGDGKRRKRDGGE